MDDKICNKCGACCRNIYADLDSKSLYWDGFKPLTPEFETMLIPLENRNNFYKCKFLKDNLCTNPQKPDICINYPASPFTEIPDNCAYYGILFMESEKIKQLIRKSKEDILHFEALMKIISDESEKQRYQRIIDSHNKLILKYKDFGSLEW